MINVIIKKNRKEDNHCLSEITNGAIEDALKLSKEHLESESKNTKCDIHKSESKGTVTIISNNNKTNFEYSDFCCNNYKNKFKS